jgi:predicted dehydrogenase
MEKEKKRVEYLVCYMDNKIKPLQIGFIGAGSAAHSHARALKQIRGLNVQGIYSRSLSSAETLSKYVRKNNIGEATVYSSITEMANHVDILGIFTPNFVRVEAVEEIADAAAKGAELKGIACEKPLGRNVKEARRLVQLARDAELKTAYFENQIFMKPIQKQLQLLESQQKSSGPPLFVRSMQEHAGPHSAWFWDPAKQGGGVLSDMGCHSIAVGWYALTPSGKPPTYLKPVSISAECALLKWGLPKWRETLFKTHGVDYEKKPAEDFATGVVTFKNPETGQTVKAQFTNSWMFDKQGVRIFIEAMGPGYAFEFNSLNSPLQVFIGDEAATSAEDAGSALEKATASRGLLTVHFNEPDLYGFTDENEDALRSFRSGTDGFLSWAYGLEITKLVMAAYMAAEKGKTIDLTDPSVQSELETYIPLIQQGRGAQLLYP